MVGHLREEKSPETLFAAARLLATQRDIYIDHIGEPLDPALGEAARATMAAAPNYRWLGGLPHEAVRRRIQRAHLLIHASRMEGGAHVIMEAVASGTPVLASRIDGNVGMLGADYAGYFPWGDADALAALILRCHESRRGRDGDLLQMLAAQCRAARAAVRPADRAIGRAASRRGVAARAAVQGGQRLTRDLFVHVVVSRRGSPTAGHRNEIMENLMPKATWNGAVLAQSDTFETVEGNIYFPRESISCEYFERARRTRPAGGRVWRATSTSWWMGR